jgi:hypothetical protein
MASLSHLINDTKVPNKAYPELRSNYTFKTGITGENIREIFEEHGYKTKEHLLNESGTDIVIEDYNVGIEVWNWSSPHSYDKRLDSIIKNLEPFDNRFLISSFISPETRDKVESYYIKNPICVIELEFQILPKEYLSFYHNNNDTGNKKFDSERTKKIIENRIKPILERLDTIRNIIIKPEIPIVNLMYIDEGYVYGPDTNPINCNLEPNNSQNRTETNKTEVLNRYFPDENITKADEKELLPVKLDCNNCKNKDSCSLLNQVQNLWNKKPQIYLKQFNIDSSFKVDSINLKKFRDRKKEWLKELGVIQNLQYKCLNKRAYLHLNMNYKLFNVEPSSNTHKF